MAELSIVAWANSPDYRPASARSKPRGLVRNGVQITPTRARILAALLGTRRPLSAAKIGLAVGCARSTSVANIGALMRAGLVQEAGHERNTHGGPRIPVYALAEKAGEGDDE